MPYKPKALWDRFNLFYALRVHRERALKRALAAAGALLALAWVIATLVRGDERPFNSGVMSVGHAMLADRCAACHTPDTRFSRFRFIADADKAHALNRACLDCHGSTIGYDPETSSAWHQVSAAARQGDPQAEEPRAACSACHAEHEGFVRLTALDDRLCTSCHADLERARPGTRFYGNIARFDISGGPDQPGLHPEFRFKQERGADPGTIRFNHALHLRNTPSDPSDPNSPRGIPAPARGHVVLRCDDCHRAGRSNRDWPYANAKSRSDQRRLVSDVQSSLQDPFIAPIRFDLHCAACHQPAVTEGQELVLAGERTQNDGDVPHGEPGDIRDYIQQRLLAYLSLERSVRKPPTDPDNRLPGVPQVDSTAPQSEQTRVRLEFIDAAARVLEKDLLRPPDQHRGPTLRVGCAFCHQLQPPGPSAPSPIVPAAIPERWLLHASFDHLKHREVASLGDSTQFNDRHPADRDCLSCHAGVLTSESTADVSLPGIDTCRACHAAPHTRSGLTLGGVGYGCVGCHSFHRAPTLSPAESARTSTPEGSQDAIAPR